MTENKFTVLHIGNTGSKKQHKVYSVSAPGTHNYTVTPDLNTATWVYEIFHDGCMNRRVITCSPMTTDFLISVVDRHLAKEVAKP